MPDTAIGSARAGRPANPAMWIGVTILTGFALLALLGERIAPYDPTAQDLLAIMEAPSAAHLLGADAVGRDILSRIMSGTRYTLSVALASVFLAGIGGIALGSIAGYFGGAVDRVATALIDLFLTVPNLVFAIAIAAAAGASATGLTVAITVTFIPPLARLVRSRVLELREEEFIGAALTIGMSHRRVLMRHVLPNAVTVIVIEMSLLAGQAVLVGSALGFLGLGVQPPAPEWGAMLGASREYLTVAPHLVIAPGVAISLLVLGFNMLGDGLRDLFDPNIQS